MRINIIRALVPRDIGGHAQGAMIAPTPISFTRLFNGYRVHLRLDARGAYQLALMTLSRDAWLLGLRKGQEVTVETAKQGLLQAARLASEATETSPDPEFIAQAHLDWRAEVEPVLFGETNTEDDRRLFHAWLMVKKNTGPQFDVDHLMGSFLKGTNTLDPVCVSDAREDQFNRLYEFLAQSDPRKLYLARDGTVRLSWTDARDAVQKSLGARRRTDSRLTELPTGANEIPSDERSVGEPVEAVDAARAARTAFEARKARKGGGAGSRIVLAHWEELLAGELSIRDLARRTGLHNESLRVAWRAELDAVRRTLKRQVS